MRVTFSIDDATDAVLRRIAAALRTSKSDIVRRAILEFDARRDRLTEAERRHKLQAIQRLKHQPTDRSQDAVDRELAKIRRSRRIGWRSQR